VPGPKGIQVGAYRATPGRGPIGRAFHITTPPSRLRLDLSPSFVRALDHSTFSLGQLVGTSAFLPNAEHFVEMSTRIEALLSSRIEGTRTSLSELLAPETTNKARDDDLVQVRNHLRLLRSLGGRDPKRPLTIKELEADHEMLLGGTAGVRSLGKLRKVQNWIGSPGPLAIVSFVPPPPEEVPQALQDLVDFVNDDQRFPPIVKAAITHCYFETIHPFADGNGRIGRFLIHFVLWKEGLFQTPILYLSHYIRATQQDYYALLQKSRTARGVEAFAAYLVEGVGAVADEAMAQAKLVLALHERYEARIAKAFGGRSVAAHNVLVGLYGEPISDVATIAGFSGASLDTGYRLVRGLVKLGILKQVTSGKRNRAYALAEYLDLFEVLDEDA
jgi:Fic family protein